MDRYARVSRFSGIRKGSLGKWLGIATDDAVVAERKKWENPAKAGFSIGRTDRI
jgi:hypothetical protein